MQISLHRAFFNYALIKLDELFQESVKVSIIVVLSYTFESA